MNNNSEMVSTLIKNYSSIRFGFLLNSWLNKASERVPKLSCVSEVFYPEDLGRSLVVCPCNDDTHRIRYLYKIVLVDETSFKCGTRCLQTLGYPKSFGARLDKIRRIIQRDIETMTPLEENTARAQTSIYKTWIQAIIENKYYPGLLFLENFGAVLNGLIECGFDLPQWLRVMLKRFFLFALKEAPILKLKRLNDNRQKYQEEFEFLENLDKNIIYGRSPWVKDMLKLINNGEKLLAWQINKIKELKRKEIDDELITKTEKALPFLTALTSGSITITKYDATPTKGQKLPIFLSYLEHIKKNVVLSILQLDTLRWKYNSYYKTAFKALPEELRTTTKELVQKVKTLDKADEKLVTLKAILMARNVEVNYLQI